MYTTNATGNICYRTRVFRSLARAQAFAKMINANPRFEAAEVIYPENICGFWVEYQPTSQARKAHLISLQATARAARAAVEIGEYTWKLNESETAYEVTTTAGKSYEVAGACCTCADWTYRGSKTGIPCKHMIAMRSAIKAKQIAAVAESVVVAQAA